MSARGTITSPTRRSRKPRMFLSIRLSSGEKPDSPGDMASSTSLRSARIDLARQLNSWRSVRTNQLPPFVGGEATGTGRWRGSKELPVGRELGGSLSGIAVKHCPFLVLANDRDRRSRFAPGYRVRALPSPRLENHSGDRSPGGAEIHALSDGQDGGETARSLRYFHYAPSHNRWQYRRSTDANSPPREMTVRWL